MAEQARDASPPSPGQVARLIWRSLDKKAQRKIVSKAKLNLALKRDFYRQEHERGLSPLEKAKIAVLKDMGAW